MGRMSWLVIESIPDSMQRAYKRKGRPERRPADSFIFAKLQRRFDLKSPGFQQRFGNVLGVLVAPRPLAQTGGANVLVGRELELFNRLLKRRIHRDYRPDRLRFAP